MVTIDGPTRGWGILLSVFFVAVGLWLAIWPEPAWRLRHLFSFSNPDAVKPSAFVLAYYRVSGVLSIVVGGAVLWMALRFIP